MLPNIRAFIASLDRPQKTGIGILIVLVLALPLIVFVALQNQDNRQRAGGGPLSSGDPSGAVMIVLNPSKLQMAPGNVFDVELFVTAQEYNITGTDITYTYDPTILRMVSFTPSDTLNTLLVNTIDQATGKFRFSAVDTSTTIHNGNVVLGTLRLEALSKTGTIVVKPTEVVITALGFDEAITTEYNTEANYLVALPTPTEIPYTYGCLTANGSGNTSAVVNTSQSATAVINGRTDLHWSWSGPGISTNEDVKTVHFTFQNPGRYIVGFTITGTTNVANCIYDVTAAPTATNTPVPPTPTPDPIYMGFDPSGGINIQQFNLWRDEFLGRYTTKRADVDRDGDIDIVDFSIWRNRFTPL